MGVHAALTDPSRWHNQLDPSVNKTPFTEWEQAVIVMVSAIVASQLRLFSGDFGWLGAACQQGVTSVIAGTDAQTGESILMRFWGLEVEGAQHPTFSSRLLLGAEA